VVVVAPVPGLGFAEPATDAFPSILASL